MDSDADPIFVPEAESDSSSAHHEDDTDLENVVPPTDAESDDSVPYPALIPAKTGTTFSRTQTENLQINPGITSTVSTSKDNTCITVQSSEGRKSWMCAYCGKPQKRLPRHLVTMHSDEESVREYAQSKDANCLHKIRNVGNHLHNLKVLKDGHGPLIVVHRPSKNTPNAHSDYVPCPDCYGYFRKSLLYRHDCPFSSSTSKTKSISRVRKGQCLLPNQPEDSAFATFLMSFSTDAVSRVAKSDSLILKFAQMEFEKNGHDRDMHNCIRSQVRNVAKVLMEMRSVLGKMNASLAECISPEKFDTLVLATKQLCGYDDLSQLFEKPSLAKSVGRCMKKCALLKQSESVQKLDSEQEHKATQFVKLMELTWNQRISHHALRTLVKKKLNAPALLPVTSDVMALSSHLDSEVKRCIQNLEDDVSVQNNWQELCSATLTQIIMFNRRRQGEVSKMKVTDFTEHRQTQHDQEILDTAFSKLERALCRSLTRIEITGKRGRTVPILLTESMKRSLSTLVAFRDEAGINPENPYLFARMHYSLGHVRGSDSIREAAADSCVKHPETLTSTKLRKQIATISQVVNLKDHELDVLADFMGHDIRIHRQYYRLPEQTFQAAKIAKLLLAVEKGELASFRGQSLDDINISADDGMSNKFFPYLAFCL